jgi:hypothetical protein
MRTAGNLGLVWGLLIALILPSVTLAQAPGPQQMTAEQLNKLDRKEAEAFPVEQALPALGLQEQGFYAMTENALLTLRYLIAVPTGKPSPQLTSAMKAFQADLGHRDTGILLIGEYFELMTRSQRIEPAVVDAR